MAGDRFSPSRRAGGSWGRRDPWREGAGSGMEVVKKFFDQLTVRELFQIYRLRTAVFVVEQHCPYQEVDDADLSACHILLREGGELAAYLRLLPGAAPGEAVIGRVVAARRRAGLGSRVLAEGIRAAREQGAAFITLAAQVYARGLYQKAGFRAVSAEFLEDGIPHVKMRLELSPQSTGPRGRAKNREPVFTAG